MVKQKIEVSVVLGYEVYISKVALEGPVIAHRKAPYYEELQNLFLRGYEDIGNKSRLKVGDILVIHDNISHRIEELVNINMHNHFPLCYSPGVLTVLRRTNRF